MDYKITSIVMTVTLILCIGLNMRLANINKNLKSMAVERGCAKYSTSTGCFEWEIVK